MITSENAEAHVQSWLLRMYEEGRITADPDSRVMFADLYDLYRATVQGESMGRTFFSVFLDLNGIHSVSGTGNKRYKVGLHIPDGTHTSPHTCGCGRKCWGSPAS